MLIRNAPPTPGSLYVVTKKAQHNSSRSKKKEIIVHLVKES